MIAAALNVNVTCLACDGVRPCADCRALGRSIAAAGHRVFRSSRYAALRAATDGTYGFTACVVPVENGEQHIVDAVVALLPDARVALATDDSAGFAPLPPYIYPFSRADYLAGRPPSEWLRSLKSRAPRPSGKSAGRDLAERSAAPSELVARATRRLRALPATHADASADAIVLLLDELAWYRASGIGFAVLLATGAGMKPEHIKTAMTASLRAGDSVGVQQGQCLGILPATNLRQAKRIAVRAVAAATKRLRAARDALRCGIAVCPDDGSDADALLAAARSRM